jgi:hypothetical protein
MDGLHSNAQNAVQGSTAKEITDGIASLIGGAVDVAGDTIELASKLFNNNKKKDGEGEDISPPPSKKLNSAELGKQLGKATQELGDTARSAIALPVKAVQQTIEIVKLVKEFVQAKGTETFYDIKLKLSSAKQTGLSAIDEIRSKLITGIKNVKGAANSIKNFLFDRTKGKVNIKEEIRGNRTEQAKKFIDLLKTEAGEQAPHDFHNVEIKSEGIKLLEVKDGMVELNTIAEQMNSEIVQTAMTQNTIPAVLNPSLANVDSDSLTGQILAEQQVVEVNGEGLDPTLANQLDELLAQVGNQAATDTQANTKSESESENATDTLDLITANQSRLENLVQMHKLAADKDKVLTLDGNDRVTVTAQAAIGEAIQYNVATKGNRPYTFIASKDGEVITYDANIESIEKVLDSAEVAFNPELNSQFTVNRFSKNSTTTALHQFSSKLATMPEGEQSVTIGERTYQVTKDTAKVTVTASDDSQLTIQADGKVSSSGTVINELFEGGKSSISTKLIAKIQAENNEVKEILSRERGAMNQGDLDRAEGLGKEAKTELSEVQGLNANLNQVAETEVIIEPTTVRPEKVFDLLEEVEAEENKVEAQTQSEVIITNGQLKDLRDYRWEDIKDVLYTSLGKNDRFGSRIEKMQDAADKFIANDEYAALEELETTNVEALVNRLEKNIRSEEIAIPEFAAHLEENLSLLAADRKESLVNIQSRTESLADAKVLLTYIQNKYLSKDITQEIAGRSTSSKYILIEKNNEELVRDRHAEIGRAIRPRDRKLTTQTRASNLNKIVDNPKYQGIKLQKETIIGIVKEDIETLEQNRGVLLKNLEARSLKLDEVRKIGDSSDEQYLEQEIERLTKFVESDDRELETLSQLKEYIDSPEFKLEKTETQNFEIQEFPEVSAASKQVPTSATISSPSTISLASLNESSETDRVTSSLSSTAQKAGSLASLNDSDENEAITGMEMSQEPELEMAN